MGFGAMIGVDRIITIIDLQLKGVAAVMTAGKHIQHLQEKTVKTRGQIIGLGMSMLFAGMAVKRLGENILKSLVKTYMTATDEQSRLNQAVLGVQASFEFLKFSIMDTLGNSDLVIGFIEALITMVNWMGAFVSKHPQLALILGVFTGMMIVLGSVSMVMGQIYLLSYSLGIGFLPLIGIFITLSAVVALLVSLFTTDMRKANPVLIAIQVILLLIGLAVLSIISPVLGLIMVFITIGVIIAKLKSDFGSFGNFFKAVLRGLIMAFGYLGQFLIQGILTPLQLIAVAVINLIEMMNKLLPSNLKISTGGLKDFVNYKPDIIGSAASLANSIKFDETKGNLFQGQGNTVNVTVEGDVTDAHLMDRIKAGFEDVMNETSVRYNGTPTGG